jgi:nitronate monooxygenase
MANKMVAITGLGAVLASLATAVAKEGGMGTITSMRLGDLRLSGNEFNAPSREALIREINKAMNLTSGLLAINVMGALNIAADL